MLLSFLRDLVNTDGIVSADLFSNTDSLDGYRRRELKNDIIKECPSALYDFSDKDIHELAEITGIECTNIDYQKKLETRFATFKKL